MNAPERADVKAVLRDVIASATDAGAFKVADERRKALSAFDALLKAANGIMDPHNPMSVNAQYDRLEAALARCQPDQEAKPC